MDLSHVVSSIVYLSDARHFSAMNEVYRTYLPDAPPVRATLEADVAIPAALTEIVMIAVKPGVERKVIMPAGRHRMDGAVQPGHHGGRYALHRRHGGSQAWRPGIGAASRTSRDRRRRRSRTSTPF